MRLWRWRMDGRRVVFRGIRWAHDVELAMLEREECGTTTAEAEN